MPPAQLFNAPLLTWLLGGAGAWLLILALPGRQNEK